MSVFDYAGSNDAPDAGGVGAPPVPPVAGLPAMSAAPTAPTAPAPSTDDPRLAAVLASLQPKPQPPAWQAALQRIAPIIGALVSMRNNAGGAFAQSYDNAQTGVLNRQILQQKADEDSAQAKLKLATILHQQAMERHQANMETIASTKNEAKAKSDLAAKQDKVMRDEWIAQSQGGLVDSINELIKTKGPEAADQYMASTEIGSLNDQGLPHTVKDLVDKYAVKAPDGTLIGGKAKTVKETKAGTQEDWVSTAENIAAKKAGRDLTDEERQAVDAKALTEYKNLSKNPDDAELARSMKRLNIAMAEDRMRKNKEDAADIEENAQGIIDGTLPPDTARLYGKSAAVKAKLHAAGFDLAKAELDWKGTQRYLQTLNGQQQVRLRQAVSFTKESLSVIEDLSRQWKGGPFPLLNKANLIAATHGAYGVEAASIATRLVSQVNDLTSELGTVYKGGYSATDESLKLAAQNLKAEWDERVLADNIKQVRQNLQIRENSIKNGMAVGTSPSNPYQPTHDDDPYAEYLARVKK